MCLSNAKRWNSMEPPKYRLELTPSFTSMPKALVDFKAYWDRKRGDRLMPARADIDPLELREHLGWILITEVVGETRRLRYRLVGSEIAKRLGCDSTNKYRDDLYPAPDRDKLAASSHRAPPSGSPPGGGGGVLFGAHPSFWLGFLALPLSQDGVDVNMILTRGIIENR